MKKILLTKHLLCAFLFAIFSTQTANAQYAKLTTNNVVSAKSGMPSAKDGKNFKHFFVDASEAGAYNVNFWLLPAKYANGSFTTFYVYVNNEFAGSIKPEKGGWQQGATSGKSLKLKKGENTISVATNAPEMPNVESVRISQKAAAARYATAKYESYVKSAAIQRPNASPSSPSRIINKPIEEENGVKQQLPLKYSFQNTFAFTEGQEIFITSSSLVNHAIDLLFCGEEAAPTDLPIVPVFGGVDRNKGFTGQYTLYKAATSEEMQGLSFIAWAEKSINDQSVFVATVKCNIPKTGVYMRKMRSAENGVLSTADLNVNGMYFYDDAPIYYSSMECEIPADGGAYTSTAKFTTEDGAPEHGDPILTWYSQVDPMLFVESKIGGNKIVGFNDDSDANGNSSITQSYIYPVQRLHVCNFSSIEPEITCTVTGGVRLRIDPPVFGYGGATDIQGVEIGNDGVSIKPASPQLASSVTISSKNMIKQIHVYDVAGNKIATRQVGDYVKTFTTAELGVTQRGLYVIKTETESGIRSEKILVR